MADVKWIKIVTDIFDDEKILMIESMPDADSIIVIWFKLLCLAGKQNNGGVIMLNDRIPYTSEMLATVFRRELNTVRLALELFQKYGMIEIVEDVITIPNWSKHQSLDALESKRERDRMRKAMKRNAQKALVEQTLSAECPRTVARQSLDSRPTVNGKSLDVAPIGREEEKEKDKDKDKDTSSNEEVLGGDSPPDPTFISIILNNGTYYDVPMSKVERWKELYPAVDVEQELRKMAGWSEENQKKRKTRTGVGAFINNWLAREQDKDGKGTSYDNSQKSSNYFMDYLREGQTYDNNGNG